MLTKGRKILQAELKNECMQRHFEQNLTKITVLKFAPVVRKLASKSFTVVKHLQTTTDNYVIGGMCSEIPSPLRSDK